MARGSSGRGAFQRLALIAVFAAMLRAFVPIGHMISVEDGRLALVPCTGAIVVNTPSKIAPSHTDHHSHHGTDAPGSTDDPSGQQHPTHGALASCPFAVACCAALSLPDAGLDIIRLSAPAEFIIRAERLSQTHLRLFSARGPPAIF
jgi:hypothetical protein